MNIFKRFIFLKKSEPKKTKRQHAWVIDEGKYMTEKEVMRLRKNAAMLRDAGLKKEKFSPVRNWFMIELALNAGLRVQEMASLTHGNFLISDTKSSIIVMGKGNKIRPVWISEQFKKTYLAYLFSISHLQKTI